MKLSIIIPCYNDHKFVLEAVHSAFDQTYVDKEIIVVDDGSDEQTKRVLRTINLKDVRVVHQKNRGLSGARNKGILESKGTYIMLLDSDDKFDKTFAEKAINILNRQNNVGVVTCWGKRFIGDTILNTFKPRGGSIENFLFSNSSIGTSMLRKSIWEKVGGYDEQMKNGYEDWEFYIRATQLCSVYVLKEFLFYYRQHKKSMRIEAINHYDVEIKKYIYQKHKDLYIKYYNQFVDFNLNEIDRYKKAEKKQIKKIDYRLGNILLRPYRLIKKIFNA